jgi:hypothetical protein
MELVSESMKEKTHLKDPRIIKFNSLLSLRWHNGPEVSHKNSTEKMQAQT